MTYVEEQLGVAASRADGDEMCFLNSGAAASWSPCGRGLAALTPSRGSFWRPLRLRVSCSARLLRLGRGRPWPCRPQRLPRSSVSADLEPNSSPPHTLRQSLIFSVTRSSTVKLRQMMTYRSLIARRNMSSLHIGCSCAVKKGASEKQPFSRASIFITVTGTGKNHQISIR